MNRFDNIRLINNTNFDQLITVNTKRRKYFEAKQSTAVRRKQMLIHRIKYAKRKQMQCTNIVSVIQIYRYFECYTTLVVFAPGCERLSYSAHSFAEKLFSQ